VKISDNIAEGMLNVYLAYQVSIFCQKASFSTLLAHSQPFNEMFIVSVVNPVAVAVAALL